MNVTKFENALSSLNPGQKSAVEAIEGPVMVNAGPGTGKTQILTLRIANILKQTDTKPEQILALTFTNAGSFTMRERLNQYIDDVGYRVQIFTFHAFCQNVINHTIDYFPQFEYSHVIDDLQKVKIIESILKNGDFNILKGSYDEFQRVQDIVRAVNTVKKEGVSPKQFRDMIPKWKDELYQDETIFYKRKYKEFSVGDIKPVEEEKITKKIAQARELADLYEKYQEQLTLHKLYDFSDMILTVLDTLKTNENFKFDLQEQYQYILVDEHQDTNEGQNELIELLTDAQHLNKRPNIFTVGDEKQSIYRFQGASEETFKHFNTLYDDIKHISLIENYRSTQNILSASTAVIEHSLEDVVHLKSNAKENNPITIGGFSNYKFELLYVVDEIDKKIKSGIKPEEIAILYRANKHLLDVKHALAYKQIPFSIFSKDSVFEDIDISNLILLLRVILNPMDEESLGKSLFINFLKIDGYDAFKILNGRAQYVRDQKKLLDIISSEEVLKTLQVENSAHVLSFSKIIREAIVNVQNDHILEFLKEFLMNIGYMEYMLASDMSRDKMVKLDTLFDEIKRQINKGVFTISDFLSLVDSYHSHHIDMASGSSELHSGVQLMTAHGSKGKEFEYVYIINTTRSNWEKSRSFGGIALPIQDYKGDEHDERRLFYVAMTRAKKGLTITYSKTNWEGKEQEKSQFISEISLEIIEQLSVEDFERDSVDNFVLFLQPLVLKKSLYEPAFIKERYLKRGLSVTALNNYISCPIKYFYKNLIQIPNGYSAHMQYGHVVHTTLEKFMKECGEKERVVRVSRLIELFKTNMDYSSLDEKDKQKYTQRGITNLTLWYKSRSKNLITTVNTEESIKRDFELDAETSITLKGNLDKIEYIESEDGGPINLIDYKTGKGYSKKNKIQKDDLKRQLTFYHILLEGYKNDMYYIKNTSLDFIEVDETDENEFTSISISAQDIQILKEVIADVSQNIISTEFLKQGCQKKDCEWCLLHNSSIKK